ncbi:hypothetical protein MMC26_004020 [Xylographa opegraphella]|nr:hypothetical protein [Xylographa opegraphella]
MASSGIEQPMDSDSGFPRISQTAWDVDIWVSLVIALAAAGGRTYFRLRVFRRLAADDCFLLLSTVTFAGSIVCAWLLRENVYLQVASGLGTAPYNPDHVNVSLQGDKLYLAASTLIWASLFSIKFSFMFFFHNLVRRVRMVEFYWWAVMAFLVPSALINIFFGFFWCTDFTIDFLNVCSQASFLGRLKTYIYLTTVLDIVTDVLIVSVPVFLLWNVNITRNRKIGLCVVLGLSTVMVIFALIRVTLSTLNNGTIDSVWLFFWSETECCVAIIMVSLTAVRGLFGIESSRNSKDKKLQYARQTRTARGLRRQENSEDAFYEGLPETPDPAALGLRTLIRSSRQDLENGEGGVSGSGQHHHGIMVTKTHQIKADRAESEASREEARDKEFV